MFQKGVSGNPGGRPTIPEELKTKLRAGFEDAVAFWFNTLADEDANWDYRNRAAVNIANYAYGKPKEIIDVEHSGRIEGFTINIVKKTGDDD
jgi:hypothetical protein